MEGHEEEAAGLLQNKQEVPSRASIDSNSSASITSLVFERIDERNRSNGISAAAGKSKGAAPYAGHGESLSHDDGDEKEQDLENGPFITGKKDGRSCTKLVWILGGILIGTWVLATIV